MHNCPSFLLVLFYSDTRVVYFMYIFIYVRVLTNFNFGCIATWKMQIHLRQVMAGLLIILGDLEILFGYLTIHR